MFNYGWTLRRKQGIRTILVSQVFEYKFQRQAFDEIKVFFSYSHLERIMAELGARYEIMAVIGSLQPALQSMVLLRMQRYWPVFIDHYDSMWGLWHFSKFSTDETGKFDKFSMEEIEAEKFCFSNADGVLARSGALPRLFEETGVATPVRLFEDKCNEKFFQPITKTKGPKRGEWSVVYPGIFYPMSYDSRFAGDIQFVPLGRLFAEERIHFHLYPSPHHNYQYPEYKAEAARNPYFHIHPAVDFDKVHKEISQYDFGWQAQDFTKAIFFSEASSKYELSIKFYSFLEAGLPIVINDLIARGHGIIKESGAGICTDRFAPRGLRKLIEASDMAAMRDNVDKARQCLEIDQISDQLLAFLQNPEKVEA